MIMKSFFGIIIILATLLLSVSLNAQINGYEFGTNSKKALRYYKLAESEYRRGNFGVCQSNLEKALEKDRNFIEAWLLLGDVYREVGIDSSSLAAYSKAIQIDSGFFPRAYYFTGLLLSNMGRYKEAAESFRLYQRFTSPGDPLEQTVGKNLVHALAAAEIMANPVDFDPVSLGENINTAGNEYINTISSDHTLLIFTRRFPSDSGKLEKGFTEKLYYSRFEDSVWGRATELPGYFNEMGNIGALTLSSDGRYLFFVSCNPEYGSGSCDLFYCLKNIEGWGYPVNLGPIVNTGYWESTPSFSSDGKTLYFASTRRGGIGNSDIWKTVFLADGTWSKPENLGIPVNTPKQEMAPFIHADDKTVYFSSEGHPGLGKADLFYSRRLNENLWQKPVNLGYPVNTTADEINIFIAPDGKQAYISTDKQNPSGNYDIYCFDLPAHARAEAVTYMKGVVRDNETLQPLKAHFELIDISANELRVESYSDENNGSFLVVLPLDKDYALHVKKEGYLFYSEHFKTLEASTEKEPVINDIFLKPVRENQVLVMNNVFFETNQYGLKPESFAELNSLVSLLKANQTITVEIGGHTDNTGLEDNNMVLSENRALAVKDYLISNGIRPERLSAKGFGSAYPVATNHTDEGRALNRRTEVRVVSVQE